MLKKMGLMLLLAYGYNMLAGEYDSSDEDGVVETKNGFSEPVNFFKAYEQAIAELSDLQICILHDIIFNQDKSQALELPSEMQQWLINFGHLLPEDLVPAVNKLEASLGEEDFSEELELIAEQQRLDKLLETEIFSYYDPYVEYDDEDGFDIHATLD